MPSMMRHVFSSRRLDVGSVPQVRRRRGIHPLRRTTTRDATNYSDSVLVLPDGAEVHAGEGWACLEEYGWRWCQAAADGLAALGIEAPRGREP